MVSHISVSQLISVIVNFLLNDDTIDERRYDKVIYKKKIIKNNDLNNMKKVIL